MTIKSDLTYNIKKQINHLFHKAEWYFTCIKDLLNQYNLSPCSNIVELNHSVCTMILALKNDLVYLTDVDNLLEYENLPELYFNKAKNDFMDYFYQVGEEIKEGKTWYINRMDNDNNNGWVEKIDVNMEEGYYVFCDYHMLLLTEITSMREMIYEGTLYIFSSNNCHLRKYSIAEKKMMKNAESGSVIIDRVIEFIATMKKKKKSDKNKKKKQAKKTKKANAKKVYCNGGCGGCYGCGR